MDLLLWPRSLIDIIGWALQAMGLGLHSSALKSCSLFSPTKSGEKMKGSGEGKSAFENIGGAV